MRLYKILGICVLAAIVFSGCGLSSVKSNQNQDIRQKEVSTKAVKEDRQTEKAVDTDKNELLFPGDEVSLNTEDTGAVTENTDQEERTKENTEGSLQGKIICLDPGHGITSESKQEKMSPLSDETKPAYVSGASGEYQTEEELNLAVAEKIKRRLEELGAEVIMTRTENEASVSNIERAEIANEADADICVRIHADGADDSSAQGFSVLVPAGDYLGTPAIIEPSREAAEAVEEAMAKTTGARDRGIIEREDLTAFNWSEVPVILVEMGFLSNSEEDQKMSTDSYREKLAEGITTGIEDWLTR